MTDFEIGTRVVAARSAHNPRVNLGFVVSDEVSGFVNVRIDAGPVLTLRVDSLLHLSTREGASDLDAVARMELETILLREAWDKKHSRVKQS